MLLTAVANCPPWVQSIVRVPHCGLPHVLRHWLAQRHNRDRLLPHALHLRRGHVSVLSRPQAAVRLWQTRWSPGLSNLPFSTGHCLG